MMKPQHSETSEADEMIRYVALRAICAELTSAGRSVNNRIIGAANRAAICMASEATQTEMMADIDSRVPGLSADESDIALKAAAQFVAREAAA